MSVAINIDHVQQMNQAPQQAGPAGSSRLLAQGLSDSDKNIAMSMHLVPLVLFLILGPFGPVGFIVPFVLWLVKKDESPFLNDHGRETMNLIITGLIASIALGLIPILGWLALIGWYIAIFIGMIRATIAGGKGEFFRYPMLIRFL